MWLWVLETTNSANCPFPAVTQSSVPIQSKFGVREVASGGTFTVYLMWDGTVLAAGGNTFGQLGDGTTTNRSNPVPVLDASGNPLSGVVGISAGSSHTVYLQGDGTVLAAGYNYFGQLGDGTTTNRTNPVQVLGRIGQPAERGGGDLRADISHGVFAGGRHGPGNGSESSYQLGDGTTTKRTNPVQALDGSGNPLSGVVGIAAGSHTLYLQGDGTVLAAGSNTYGQLGDGTTTNRQPGVQCWTDRATR